MQLKKYISIFVIAILFACVAFYCVVLNDNDCIDSVRLISHIDGHTTKISLIENNGKYYAFLPSHFELEDATFEYTSGCSLYLDGKEYAPSAPCSDLKIQNEYSMVIKNMFGITTVEMPLVIYRAENTPSIFISLKDGTIDDINADKTVEKTGTCLIVDSDNSVNYSGTFDKIHGRGNGTWVADKKPYNISFTREVDLFGMGLATDWILLSNPIDTSNLRNKIIYDFADDIGLQGSPDSRFVNLYIDGEYCGLYLLTEKVEIQQNRVDIVDLYEETKALNNAPLYTYPVSETLVDGIYKKAYSIPVIPDDITGGYLLEIQLYDYRSTLTSAFSTNDYVCFSLQSMPYVSWEQLEYISAYSQQVEDSLHNGNYEDYIDVESWARYYLVQETFANTDNRSFFYYKNSDLIDGKLYAGPVWDFDIALGNTPGLCAPDAFYINTWGWYSLLYSHESFRTYLAAEYEETIKPALSALINDTIYEYKEIESSYNMDKLRWESGDSHATLDEHIATISSYLTERTAFLDEVWLNGKQVYSITATSKPAMEISASKYYYSISVGEQLPQLPTPSAVEGYKFIGWYDSESGEPYNPDEIVESNRTFEAKWEADPVQTQEAESPSLFTRLYNTIRTNLQLFVVLFFFVVMVIFVFFRFFIDYKNKKKEDSNVKLK